MSSLMSLIYDAVMGPTEKACLIEWRQDLLKNVSGRVLEIGAGTGASLNLYPNESSLHITLSEPDKGMRDKLKFNIQANGLNNVSVLSCAGESLDCEDEIFDFVFVSLVCCSVNSVEESLAEIKRVLKPDGRFIFLEHVAAQHGSDRRQWQNWLNPFWRKIAGNCHLNRETAEHIKAAGFIFDNLTQESMRKALPFVRPTIRGIARKA